MTTYTVKQSYALGDEYLKVHNYLAAELCYALPMIEDQITNQRQSRDVNAKKLTDLKQMDYKIPPKGKDMGKSLSKFIGSFYKQWLDEIVKPAMIVSTNVSTLEHQ